MRATRSRRRRAAALALVLLSACGREAEEAEPAAAEPDGSPAVGAPMAIAATPLLSVGVLDGDPVEELDRVVSPFLLPDGGLAVPTAGAQSIRIFGPDGRFRTSYGAPGDGPGEFSSLRAAWARGDTVEAWDSGLQRITRFTPDGAVETVRVALDTLVADGALGPLAGGWALTHLEGAYGERDRTTVFAVSDSGTLITDVVEMPGMVRYVAPHVSGPHPLSPTALFAVHDDLVYAAESLTPTIRVYDALGRHRFDVPVPLQAPEAPVDVMQDVIEAAAARAREAERDLTRQRWSSYPEPERLSVFWAFIVDELGFLWIRPYDPFLHSLALDGRPGGAPGPGGRWLVLTPEGAEIGQVDVPDGLEPVQITLDAVVGVRRDVLGVESVRVHRLTRR